MQKNKLLALLLALLVMALPMGGMAEEAAEPGTLMKTLIPEGYANGPRDRRGSGIERRRAAGPCGGADGGDFADRQRIETIRYRCTDRWRRDVLFLFADAGSDSCGRAAVRDGKRHRAFDEPRARKDVRDHAGRV